MVVVTRLKEDTSSGAMPGRRQLTKRADKSTQMLGARLDASVVVTLITIWALAAAAAR